MTDWRYPTTGGGEGRRPAPGPADPGTAGPGAAGSGAAGSGPATAAGGSLPDGYQLVAHIGTGRLGSVVLCRQLDTGRELAVKVLDVRVDDERRRLGLHTELVAAAVAARHPAAVSVEDIGFTADDRPYLAMQACPGGSLGQRLDSAGPLPVAEVLVIAVRLALALHTSHQRGVLHLDVRPANVLVDPGGEALLTDAGLARAVQRAVPSAGTLTDPRYTARELSGWEPASPASDVYGLGATLYALLDGAPPHAEAAADGPAALYTEQLRGEPAPLRRPDVPEQFAALLRRMLGTNPEERPPLTEVHRILRRLLPGELAHRVPAFVPEQEDGQDPHRHPVEAAADDSQEFGPSTRRELRRNRRGQLIALGGTAALLLGVGAVALVMHLQDSGEPGRGGTPTGQSTAAASVVPEAERAAFQAKAVRVTRYGRNLMVSWKEPASTAGVSGYLVVAQSATGEVQAKQYAVSGQLNAVFTVPPADSRSCFVVTSLVSRNSAIELAPAAPKCQAAGTGEGAGGGSGGNGSGDGSGTEDGTGDGTGQDDPAGPN